MWLLPGADGNPSCNERGNEQVKDGNCFIIARTFRRPETNKMVGGGGGGGGMVHWWRLLLRLHAVIVGVLLSL